MTTFKWPGILVIAGFVLMVIAALDPLEGSVIILGGGALTTLGAFLSHSRRRKSLLWAFILMLVGVTVMFGFSAVGGFGGDTGRPLWWALSILPYPVGWVMGVIGAIRWLIDSRHERTATPQPAGS